MTSSSPVMAAVESSTALPLSTSSEPSTRPPTRAGPLRIATSPCQALPAGSRARPASRVVVGAL